MDKKTIKFKISTLSRISVYISSASVAAAAAIAIAISFRGALFQQNIITNFNSIFYIIIVIIIIMYYYFHLKMNERNFFLVFVCSVARTLILSLSVRFASNKQKMNKKKHHQRT